MRALAFFLGTFFILACSGGLSSPQALYEGDDRFDVTAPGLPQGLVRKASGTFTLIERTKLTERDGKFVVRPEHRRTLRDKFGLCPEAPFALEPAVTTCSGFLAAPDVAVTAGHCIRHVSDCDKWAFVFGYQNGRPGSRYEFSSEEIAFCPENGLSRHVVVGLDGPEGLRDFAVVKLARTMDGVSPLPMRRAGRLRAGAPLAMIGYPSGVPAKITLGGVSLREASEFSFTAHIDAFHGNSGSPVLHAETGEVEGILVRGADPDYRRNDQGCLWPRVISSAELGDPGNKETISSVESFRDAVDAIR